VLETRIDYVLFDLGGVLIELGDLAILQARTGFGGDQAEWLGHLDPWLARFETGRCSASDFASGVVADWGVETTPDQFLEVLMDWAIGPYPGTSELLAELQNTVGIGCLSNINAMHWQDQSERWPVPTTFDDHFLSFELGVRKPDRAVFQAVADRLRLHPDRILFIDDVAANVAEARAFGFRAEQVRGVDGAIRALQEVGLVTRTS